MPPPTSTPTPIQLIHAYRHLYRGLLFAVQFSKPARYQGRDKLRTAFRKDLPSQFNQARITRTVEFLRLAAKERGLEHRLVKNLLHMSWAEKDLTARRATKKSLRAKKPIQREINTTVRMHYDMTLAMLNDSMGLCLR